LAYVDSNFNIPDAAARCPLEFYGTKGSIIAVGTLGQDEAGSVEMLVCDDSSEYDAQQNRNPIRSETVTVEFGNMYTREIESFGNSILNGTPLEVPASDAVYVQRVMEAAYRANDEKTVIDL
jgi:predicted dehydrogenase